MLDINFIREHKDIVKKSIQARKADVDLEKLLKLDVERKDLIQKVDGLRAKRNEAAKARDKGEGARVKEELKSLEKQLSEIEKKYNNLMLQVPNIPLDTVPEGDASDNKILRQEGSLPSFSFSPRDHVELGEKLDIIDIQRASKISGSRFAYLKNEGTMLELALVQYAMQTLVKKGFTPIIPPALIKKEITDGLGYWQGRIDERHTANENYYLVYDPDENDSKKSPNLYLIGTGEHALVPMHADEVLDESQLPKKYVAFSPCFRREAGSYGKDTKGILRVHQFDKVEMVKFVKTEDDEKERREMLAIVEELMKSLGLPYQVVQLASGDLGFPTAETIDIETWMPFQGQYRETHSISTTTDFQSRRLGIKYNYVEAVTHKPDNPRYLGQIERGIFRKSAYVHILNGTVFAIGRMIIAILENFQTEDGTVKIPEALQKYTGFSEIKPK